MRFEESTPPAEGSPVYISQTPGLATCALLHSGSRVGILADVTKFKLRGQCASVLLTRGV